MSVTTRCSLQIDVVFTQTLYGIRDVDKGGISETDFSEVLISLT